jgi:hypothetical protein
MNHALQPMFGSVLLASAQHKSWQSIGVLTLFTIFAMQLLRENFGWTVELVGHFCAWLASAMANSAKWSTSFILFSLRQMEEELQTTFAQAQ